MCHSGCACHVRLTTRRRSLQGYICASVVTTIFYLARKAVGLDQARRQVRTILAILNVAVRTLRR